MDKLIEEVNFFKKIKLPLKMHVYHDNSFQLFSEDYTKAEDFDLSKMNEDLGGYTSHYDGGYYTTKHNLYPQFYFNIKKGLGLIPVFIQHEGFEKDKSIILYSKEETIGTKDYSDHAGIKHHNINYKKTINFFEERGVPKNLIKKLEKDFKKLKEML